MDVSLSLTAAFDQREKLPDMLTRCAARNRVQIGARTFLSAWRMADGGDADRNVRATGRALDARNRFREISGAGEVRSGGIKL